MSENMEVSEVAVSTPDSQQPYDIRTFCCCAGRNKHVATEIYSDENSALHQHLLHSERVKNVIQKQPSVRPSLRQSSRSLKHSVSNSTAHYEVFNSSDNEGYYSTVPLQNGKSYGEHSHAHPRPNVMTYQHYEFADEMHRSDAELLPRVSERNGVSCGRQHGGSDAALEYSYGNVSIDRGVDIYDTVPSSSGGSAGDRLVAGSVAGSNYEVSSDVLPRSTPAASRGLPVGTSVEEKRRQEAELEGSHGYAYAFVKGRSNMSNDYRVPARDVSSLYAQFEVLELTVIQRSDVKLGDFLGSGQFGTVYQGEWSTPKGKVPVAVKTLHENIHEKERVRFLQEAAMMGQFDHLNVVKMYGLVNKDPLMIVLELLPKGDLRQKLISVRSEGGVDSALPPVLLKYCREIAFGMCYLSTIGFVHRDLAARNILVSGDGTCKVADFGMARDLTYEDYYISHGGQVPVKWTAPEALHYKKYSTASDVWSYGVVMYEIWSLGHKPFEMCTNNEALRKIDRGIRLPPPPGCPRAVYAFMMKCWNPETSRRPVFQDAVRFLFTGEEALLKWSVKDKAVHISACWLAADLEVAEKLHQDLQELYRH